MVASFPRKSDLTVICLIECRHCGLSHFADVLNKAQFLHIKCRFGCSSVWIDIAEATKAWEIFKKELRELIKEMLH